MSRYNLTSTEGIKINPSHLIPAFDPSNLKMGTTFKVVTKLTGGRRVAGAIAPTEKTTDLKKGMTINLPSVGKCTLVEPKGNGEDYYTAWEFYTKINKPVANFTGSARVEILIYGWNQMLTEEKVKDALGWIRQMEATMADRIDQALLNTLKTSEAFAQRFPDVAEQIKSGAIKSYSQITPKGNPIDIIYDDAQWRLTVRSVLHVAQKKYGKPIPVACVFDIETRTYAGEQLTESTFSAWKV